jgi:hypothetical protein
MAVMRRYQAGRPTAQVFAVWMIVRREIGPWAVIWTGLVGDEITVLVPYDGHCP